LQATPLRLQMCWGITLMHDPYIIAEIGSNCFRYDELAKNLANAKEQIVRAREAGASAVKFQYFSAVDLWGPKVRGTEIEREQDQYGMPFGWLPILKEQCAQHEIDFLCSGFSVSGFKGLAPYVKYHKLASPELADPGIRKYLQRQPRPVIWSLGCRTPVQLAGWYPNAKDVLLECVSDYPADPCHYDLFNARAFAAYQGHRWGLSDHTQFTWLARYARSYGASVFEKHVDFVGGGGRTPPDAVVSVDGKAFKAYADIVRSQPVLDHQELKKEPAERYGRRETPDGWYRPLPEG
jgi:N,N'-diacetyllegionaminate synthase